jgi:hypothetical protein
MKAMRLLVAVLKNLTTIAGGVIVSFIMASKMSVCYAHTQEQTFKATKTECFCVSHIAANIIALCGRALF